MPTQRNFLINTTTISTTASGTTIVSGNTQSATFVVALTLVRSGIAAGEFASGSQTWSIHYVVSAMTTPYEMRLKVQRRNSSGTMQAESGYTTVRTATGTYDDNLTADLGIWAANDQLALVWEHRRPSGSGNKNATIDANGSSYIDAPTPPLDLPKTATDDVNNLADARGLGYGNLHTDSINSLADTAQIALGLSLAVNDNAGNLADGAVSVTGYWATTVDSLQSLTDTLAHLLTYQLVLADSEAANWADAHNLLLSQFLALADSHLLDDAMLLSLEQREVFTDSLTLADSITHQIGVPLEPADDADSLADDFSLRLDHLLSLSDGGPNFPSTGILDDFNRANEGPPPSSNWTTGIANGLGGFGLGHSVTSNQLSNDFEQTVQDYWNVAVFGPDCEAYITVTNGSGLISIGLAARLTDLGQFTTDGYVVQVGLGGPGNTSRGYSIFRIDDSTANQIAFILTPGEGSINGDKYGIQIIGDTIYLWGDTGNGWEVKLSTVDGTYPAAGLIGIVTEVEGTSTRLDDFGGGTVAVAGLSDDLAYVLGIGPALTLEASDPLALTDSLALGHGLLPVDSLDALTDSVAIHGDGLLSASDVIVLSDSETHTLELRLDCNDAITLTDAVASDHGLIFGDSLALTDACELQLAYLISFADTLIIADSESHLLGQHESLADDIDLLADEIALRLGQELNLADTLPAIADAHALELGYSLPLADLIVLGDDYAADLANTIEGSTEEFADDVNLLADQITIGIGLALNDTAANLSDAVTNTLGHSLLLADDVATLNDIVSLQLQQLLSFDDSLTLIDSAVVVLEQRQSLADSVSNLADAVVIELGQRLDFDDSIENLTDAATVVLGELLSFSDLLMLTDSAYLGYGLALADDVNLLIDSIITSAPQGPLRQVGVTDSIDTLAESLALRLDHLLSMLDTISFSDAIALDEGLLTALTDTLTLTDAVAPTLDHLLPLADSFALSDSVQLRLGHELSITDVIALTDTATNSLSYHLSLSDNAALLADSALKSLGLTLIIADNGPTLLDGIDLFSAWGLSLADSLALTDSLAKFSAGFLPLDDSLSLADDIALDLRGPDLETALSDSLTLTDVIAFTLGNELQLQVVISDLLTLTDHYFDLRHPYTPSAKRHIVVPSRARTTTVPERQRVTVVPGRDRTTRVE